MKTLLHLQISLRGALINWQDREWRNCVKNDQGRTLSPQEVKAYFLDCLSEGKKLIPMDPSCEGFDYQTGCPGHRIEE